MRKEVLVLILVLILLSGCIKVTVKDDKWEVDKEEAEEEAAEQVAGEVKETGESVTEEQAEEKVEEAEVTAPEASETEEETPITETPATVSETPAEVTTPVEEVTVKAEQKPINKVETLTPPESKRLDVSAVYSGVKLAGNHYRSLDYIGAFAMIVGYYDEVSLDDVVAASGTGVKAYYNDATGISNGYQENSIMFATEKLGYKYVVGYTNGGKHTNLDILYEKYFTAAAETWKTLNSKDQALLHLKRVIFAGNPVVVLVDTYYIYDELAKQSDVWKGWKKEHSTHFMTATGYDKDYVYLNDPSDPNSFTAKDIKVSQSTFINAWAYTATPSIIDTALGPFWMLYLYDRTTKESAGSIIEWNRVLGRDSYKEIKKSIAGKFLNEEGSAIATARLEFGKYLKKNGQVLGGRTFEEAGNGYLALHAKSTQAEFDAIADKEAEALSYISS